MHALADLDLPTWSALLAALASTVFALRLWRTGSFNPSRGRASLLFAAAIVASAAWGWAGAVTAYHGTLPGVAVRLLDLVRYGCWFAFVLSVLSPVLAARRMGDFSLLVPSATILVAVGLAILAFGAAPTLEQRGGDRDALFEALALPVLGLILVEQLFCGVDDGSRWNAKPLCLGLCVVFAFDLYVYSQAVLFGDLDDDAVSIRAGIHAIAVPLLFMAARRRNDWIVRLKISRAAAFHTTALFLAGIYLLFVAAVGY